MYSKFIFIFSILINILFFKINIDPFFENVREQCDSYVRFGKATTMVIKTIYLY